MAENTLMEAIEEAGGFTAFALKMGSRHYSEVLKSAAKGKRIPRASTRRKMIEASGGRLTDEDIVGITGRSEASRNHIDTSDRNWGRDEESRRDWIRRRAAAAARAQLEANK